MSTQTQAAPPTVMDGYVRVSRVMGREGESFHSPEDQRERIEAWAKSRGIEIAEMHVDLDESGGVLSRPGLDRLMERIRSGATGGVAVAYVDRLSRANVADALKVVEEIHDHGGKLAALDLGIDPTSAFGEFGMTVLLALGRMQRRRVTDTWDSSVSRAVARGAFPALAPFGYVKDDSKRLHPCPDDAPYARAIFLRRGTGETWASIAQWLNDSGAKPRRADEWTPSTVKDIVRHEVYLGTVAKQGHRNENAHEPLVSTAEWRKAQNVHSIVANTSGEGFLLAGLLRCAGCSYGMAGSSYGSKATGQTRQYVCKRRHGSGTCTCSANINASRVEPFIIDQFFARVDALAVAPIKEAPEIDAADAALAAAESVLVEYRDNPDIQAVLGLDGYIAGLNVRQDAVASAAADVREAHRKASGVDLPAAAELRESWPTLTVGEQRRLLGEVIDVAFVKRGRGADPADRVHICWRGEAPAGLPSKGRTAPLAAYPF
jgi:site-specific DNA recombinase